MQCDTEQNIKMENSKENNTYKTENELKSRMTSVQEALKCTSTVIHQNNIYNTNAHFTHSLKKLTYKTQ